MRIAILLIGAVALAACTPGSETGGTEPAGAVSPPVAVMPAVDLSLVTSSVVITPTAEAVEAMSVGEGLTVDTETDGVVKIGGTAAANASYGRTSGAAFLVGPEAEAAASGQTVTITVLARSGSGEPAEFKVAYSTTEVGNSGWRNFEAGDAWATYTFAYDVSEMVNGGGDYVGIQPMAPGAEIQVAAVGLDFSPTPEPVEPEPEAGPAETTEE